MNKWRSRRASALKVKLTIKCTGRTQLSHGSALQVVFLQFLLVQLLFPCPFIALIDASSALSCLSHSTDNQICPCRQKLHLIQQRMAQMEGKGIFYFFFFFNGILVLLNAYPDIDVWPFLPLNNRVFWEQKMLHRLL